MRKELTASFPVLALVLPACAGGGGTSALPQAVATAAAVAPKINPVPDCGGLLIAKRLKPAETCPGDPTSTSDGEGDTITRGGGVYEIEGSPLSCGGFNTEFFDEDFGSYTEDDGSFAFFEQVVGYPPMSNSCQQALANLNAAFSGWLIGMAAVVVPPLRAAKITFGAATGIGAVGATGIGALNAAQLAINQECSGQGAGQNPGGALPPGYSPGT